MCVNISGVCSGVEEGKGVCSGVEERKGVSSGVEERKGVCSGVEEVKGEEEEGKCVESVQECFGFVACTVHVL